MIQGSNLIGATVTYRQNGATRTGRIVGVESHFGDTTYRVYSEVMGKPWLHGIDPEQVQQILDTAPLPEPDESDVAAVWDAVEAFREQRPWLTKREALDHLWRKANG